MRKAMLKPERREFYSDEHERIVAPVRNRDSAAAWNAMRGHIGMLVEIYSQVEEIHTTGHGSVTF